MTSTSQHVLQFLQTHALQPLQWFVADGCILLVWVVHSVMHSHTQGECFFLCFEPGAVAWEANTALAAFEPCRLAPSFHHDDHGRTTWMRGLARYLPWDEEDDASSTPPEVMQRKQYFCTILSVAGEWVLPHGAWHAQDYVSPKACMHVGVRFEIMDECREAWPALVTLYAASWRRALVRRLQKHQQNQLWWATLPTESRAHLSSWAEHQEKWSLLLRRFMDILVRLQTVQRALQLEWDSLDDATQCSRTLAPTLAYADHKRSIYVQFDKTKTTIKHALQALGHLVIHIHHFWLHTWAWSAEIHTTQRAWAQSTARVAQLLQTA